MERIFFKLAIWSIKTRNHWTEINIFQWLRSWQNLSSEQTSTLSGDLQQITVNLISLIFIILLLIKLPHFFYIIRRKWKFIIFQTIHFSEVALGNAIIKLIFQNNYFVKFLEVKLIFFLLFSIKWPISKVKLIGLDC